MWYICGPTIEERNHCLLPSYICLICLFHSVLVCPLHYFQSNLGLYFYPTFGENRVSANLGRNAIYLSLELSINESKDMIQTIGYVLHYRNGNKFSADKSTKYNWRQIYPIDLSNLSITSFLSLLFLVRHLSQSNHRRSLNFEETQVNTSLCYQKSMRIIDEQTASLQFA